jgi:CBS domain-containing protein
VEIFDIDRYVIDSKATLLECFVKFEANNVHTLLVLKGRRVIGTVTDGDIRKALIKFRTLATNVDKIMNLDFLFVHTAINANSLFTAHPYILLIPVIDSEQQILSVCVRD